MSERHLYKDIVIEPSTASDVCEQLSENSHFLDYPRTLEIRMGSFNFGAKPISVEGSIMQMIPRMANLKSLKIIQLPFMSRYERFIPSFTTCLQQSSIERLYLSELDEFPLSALSSGQNIKKLTLSGCTAKEESPSASQQSLDTLILSGNHNQDLLIWAKHRVTRLTSLGLRDLSLDLDWTAFPDLLTACSNSLTTFHLDITPNCSNDYLFDADRRDVGYWINDGPELPFSLSELKHLTNLSIFALIYVSATSIHCALREIIRLINTAPAIQHVVLCFHFRVTDITSLGRLDWSLLDRLQPNFHGARPRVHLCISGKGVGFSLSLKNILDALATNEAFMDLVKRGLVILKLERPLALWEESCFIIPNRCFAGFVYL